MKFFIQLILLGVLGVWISTPALAQKKDNPIISTEFEVSGVCKMCKNRIENAALIKGTKMAEWDKKTQLLKVVYDSRKTEEMAIHKAVAEHGHDTEKVKASDEAYQKLPDCCAYRDGVEIH